jgi:chemotaxis protein CheX
MKIEHVNPFVEATVQTFKSMCRVEPVRDGKLELKDSGFISAYDLLGVIGLSGSVKGAILMTMSLETGMKSVGAFLMDEIKEPNADLMDGFGEILNIIAGAAAAKLEGHKINLAIPTVLIGSNQQLHAKQAAPWIIIPMKFPEWGKFNIEVSMEEL